MAGMAATINIGLASIISPSLTASRHTAAWAIPTPRTASLRYGRRGDGAGGTCVTDGRRGDRPGPAFADGAVLRRFGFGLVDHRTNSTYGSVVTLQLVS